MRRSLGPLVAVVFVAFAAALPRLAHAQESLENVLARAAEISSAGRHEEAYALLLSVEDRHIGEVPFDYALGRAALNAGRPERATLAFSRVLALQPGHAGARIDMGRAYLALGNRAQAEAAFEALLSLDPPPALRAQLVAYLAEARQGTGRGVLRAYLEIAAGTSSNVNQAPGRGEVFVPGLLSVLQLSDQNVAKADSFAGISGGFDGVMPLAGRYALIGSADFLSRANAHESAFDIGGVAGSIGIGWAGELHVVRTQLQSVRSTLGGEDYREVTALSIESTETAVASGSATMFGFAYGGRYRYLQPALRIFDADFITVGAGGIFRIDDMSTLSVAVLAGGDNDRGGNPSGDRRGLGARLAWERALDSNWRLAATGNVLASHYDGFDPAFLSTRQDRRIDLEALVRRALTPALEVRLGVWRSVQDSNIPIYEYRRTDWTLALRWRFD
jgi:tetratricopeptide (TPR) repeat protein